MTDYEMFNLTSFESRHFTLTALVVGTVSFILKVRHLSNEGCGQLFNTYECSIFSLSRNCLCIVCL